MNHSEGKGGSKRGNSTGSNSRQSETRGVIIPQEGRQKGDLGEIFQLGTQEFRGGGKKHRGETRK